MAKINMDPEQAISYGNQIVQNASTYNTEIKKIYSIVGDLKATWTGSAAQRFTDNIDSFKSDISSNNESLLISLSYLLINFLINIISSNSITKTITTSSIIDNTTSTFSNVLKLP